MPEDMEIDVHRQDVTWSVPGQEQHLKLLPGHIYIHPSGYKVRMAQAPRGAELAADRARCRRAPSATSPAPCRAAASRRSARAWSTRCCRGRSTCGASTRTWRWSRRSSARDYDGAADLLARALARLGDQAAHPESRRVHAGVQRLAGGHPQPRARAGVRHQALLPPGVGRRLAQPLQRRHHQRRAGPRAQVRGPPAGRQLSPDRPGGERRLADLQAAAGLRRGRQGPDGGRHHRLGGGAGTPAGRPSRASTTGIPASSWRRTASSGCSSAPTTRSTPGSTARPRRTWRARGSSARNFEPLSAADDAQRDRRGRGAARRLHRADAGARGPKRRPRRRRLLDLLGAAAADRRQAHQEPALSAAPPGHGASARPLRGGDGRPAQPPAAAPRAGATSR